MTITTEEAERLADDLIRAVKASGQLGYIPPLKNSYEEKRLAEARSVFVEGFRSLAAERDALAADKADLVNEIYRLASKTADQAARIAALEAQQAETAGLLLGWSDGLAGVETLRSRGNDKITDQALARTASVMHTHADKLEGRG